jgi:prepilin-type N-terminal cleavage/methylation domain-containing protein
MKRGFTLIELMIVIIIIGVLATIGIVQYQAAVEKSRGAEARSVLGFLHSQCAAKWMETGDSAACTDVNMNLDGTGAAGTIPSVCRTSHWFAYTFTARTGNTATITATRCGADGKAPAGPAGANLVLNSDFSAGSSSFTAQQWY